MRKVLSFVIISLFFVIVLMYFKKEAKQYGDEITGEVVVDFKDDVSPEYIAALGKRLSIKFRQGSNYSNFDKLYVGEYLGDDEDSVIDAIRDDSNVEAADREQIYTIPEHNLPADVEGVKVADVGGESGSFPNDARRNEQWGMDQIHLPKNWDTNAGTGVIIAVIDTGVSRTKDMVNTGFVPGYNFVSNNEDTHDDQGHGTHCAGTVAQSTNNEIGVVGVAYKATIMPVKVLDHNGSGSSANIAQAIHWATDHKANVISMSLGGGGYDAVMAKAMKYAHDKGVTIVVAAGNSARGVVSYPAKYPEAIAVAATKRDERVTHYSNWGKEIAIAAPGGDGDKTKPENGILQNTIVDGKDDYYFYNGTSMAVPSVAGVVALIIEQGVKDPDIVRKILIDTARMPAGMKSKPSGYALHYGAGIVDAGRAVEAAKNFGSSYTWKIYIVVILIVFIIWVIFRKKTKRFSRFY